MRIYSDEVWTGPAKKPGPKKNMAEHRGVLRNYVSRFTPGFFMPAIECIHLCACRTRHGDARACCNARSVKGSAATSQSIRGTPTYTVMLDRPLAARRDHGHTPAQRMCRAEHAGLLPRFARTPFHLTPHGHAPGT